MAPDNSPRVGGSPPPKADQPRSGRHPISRNGGPRFPSLRGDTRGVTEEEKALLPEGVQFELERASEQHAMCLMGTSWRNSITGDIGMTGPTFGTVADFSVVDFWSRELVLGDLTDLSEDPYLFRPVPMRYRTWMYHEMYLNRHVIKSKDEYAMLKEVLGQYCIDIPGGCRFSPLMWYAPVGFACALAQDNNLAHAAVLVLFFIFGLSRAMNTMRLYRYLRIATLPVRAGFVALVILRMSSVTAIVRILGYVLVLLICGCDLYFGDLRMLATYRLHCHYEILRIYPNRVVLCRRVGGSYETTRLSKPVHQDVTGIGNWEQTFILIADIHGILYELRPVTIKDWKALWESHRAQEDDEEDSRPVFVGLDVFWEEEPTANDLRDIQDLQTMKDMKSGKLFEKNLPLKEMLQGEDRAFAGSKVMQARANNDVKETNL
jgi:hypothetical protein